MKDSKTYLTSKGWRLIATKCGRRIVENPAAGNTYMKLWDHPNHQHDFRATFTTTEALQHQERFERDGWCDCIHQPEFA